MSDEIAEELELERPDEMPSEQDFRKCGYTLEAAKYPLSSEALIEKAKFNGVDPETVPNTWWFAPNKYMQKVWEDLAAKNNV